MGKIEKLIKQIESGTYKVTSKKIAQALLNKNPKLEVVMKNKQIGEIHKGFSSAIEDVSSEEFSCLFQFNFEHNNVPYGKYLVGMELDGSATVIDFIGDNYRDFVDENPELETAFIDGLEERIEELGLQ